MQTKVPPVEFVPSYSRTSLNNLVVIVIRLFNTLGSVVTGAFIPLFLIQIGKSGFIPFMVIGMASGRILSTKLIIPKINNFSHLKVLMGTSVFGFSLLSLAAWIMFHNISGLLFLTLILVTFFVAALSTIDEAFSASLLVENEQSSRWIHSDSTLQLLARVIGPGLSAWALIYFANKHYSIFLIDSGSYLSAVIVYSFLLMNNSKESKEVQPSQESSQLSLKVLWKNNTIAWKKLIFTSFGAAAYNGGALIYLSTLKMPTTSIAIFMTAQNISMVLTSLSLTSFPNFSKASRFSPLMASLGMMIIALSTDVIYLSVGTSIMAIGMVLFMQSERVGLAQNVEFKNTRKQYIAFFTTINSTVGAVAVVIYTLFSQIILWKYLLVAGAIFLLIPIFFNLKKHSSTLSS